MNANARAVRDYSSIEIPDRSLSREERMGLLVDQLWRVFGNPKTTASGLSADEASKLAGYSWVGFYFGPGNPFVSAFGQHLTPSAHEMLLDRRQPKPACSPIGLGGMCGRSFREAVPIVVRDVATLEDGYIACDPRDRSEVVVPCFDENGEVYAVLDVDGYAPNDFSGDDTDALHDLLVRSGLSSGEPRSAIII